MKTSKPKPVPISISQQKLRKYPKLARHYRGRKVLLFSGDHGLWWGDHGLWWRTNRKEYTNNIREAGVYDFDSISKDMASAGPEKQLAYHDLDHVLRSLANQNGIQVTVPPEAGTVAAHIAALPMAPRRVLRVVMIADDTPNNQAVLMSVFETARAQLRKLDGNKSIDSVKRSEDHVLEFRTAAREVQP